MKYAILGPRKGILRVVEQEPQDGRTYEEITEEQAEQIETSDTRFFLIDDELFPMRDWLKNHRWEDGDWVEFTPPSPDRVTRRQFLRALVLAGIDPESVTSAIAQIEDETARKLALIDWEAPRDIERNHPLINQLAPAFGLSVGQIDDLFRLAADQ